MEQASKKKRKVVQPATAKEPVPEPEADVPPTPSTPEDVEAEQTQEAAAPAVLFDLRDFDPKKIAMAEDFGVPVGMIVTKLNNYVASVENRFQVIVDNMATPEKVVEALKAAAAKERTDFIARHGQNPQPQQQGGGGGGLSEILAGLKAAGLTGSDSGDDEFTKILKDNAMRNMLNSQAFDNVFREYMVKKMSKELGEQLMFKPVETAAKATTA